MGEMCAHGRKHFPCPHCLGISRIHIKPDMMVIHKGRFWYVVGTELRGHSDDLQGWAHIVIHDANNRIRERKWVPFEELEVGDESER